MAKTTARDFSIFKKAFMHWYHKFGLNSWKIYFMHEYKEGLAASCYSNPTGCVATITLSTDWEDNAVTGEELWKTARHEALELVLARLVCDAEYRFVSQDDITESSHIAIRTLESVLPLK